MTKRLYFGAYVKIPQGNFNMDTTEHYCETCTASGKEVPRYYMSYQYCPTCGTKLTLKTTSRRKYYTDITDYTNHINGLEIFSKDGFVYIFPYAVTKNSPNAVLANFDIYAEDYVVSCGEHDIAVDDVNVYIDAFKEKFAATLEDFKEREFDFEVRFGLLILET